MNEYIAPIAVLIICLLFGLLNQRIDRLEQRVIMLETAVEELEP